MTAIREAFPNWVHRLHAPRRLCFPWAARVNLFAGVAAFAWIGVEIYAKASGDPGGARVANLFWITWLLVFGFAMWLHLSASFHRLIDMDDELEQTVQARKHFEATVANAIGQIVTLDDEPAPAPKVH